jgi:hypothetical protein
VSNRIEVAAPEYAALHRNFSANFGATSIFDKRR